MNKIKLSIGLLSLVLAFTILQLVSSLLSFERSKVAFEGFSGTLGINEQHDHLVQAWVTLNHAQIYLNQSAYFNAIQDKDATLLALKNTIDTLQDAKKYFDVFIAFHASLGRSESEVADIKVLHAELLNGILKESEVIRNNSTAVIKLPELMKMQIVLEDKMEIFAANMDAIAGVLSEDTKRAYDYSLYQLILIVVICILGAVFAAYWIRKAVTHPIEALLDNFKAITEGDLTKDIVPEGGSEIHKLFEYFQRMQKSLQETVSAVRDSTHIMVDGVTDMMQRNNEIAQRTEQQAAALEETAASMVELTSTVKLNAESAHNAKVVANQTYIEAQRGGEITQLVVNTMAEISESSHKIGAITAVIDSIAFQTNILALNAAVEAARAGEQGRGFAVVAGEVRNLAQRSAQAAKEIKTLIDDSIIHVEKGVDLVRNAGETIKTIVTAVDKVSENINDISSSSDEQSRGIDMIAQAVNQMERVIHESSDLMQILAKENVELDEQADKLAKTVAMFKL